jgi:hypothetical protein
MIALMVLAILLGAAFQQWSVIHRREMEKELIFRGGQYVEAIIRFRMEHAGMLPLELEELYQPGPRGVRYIRKLFPDPFDFNEEGWGLLYLGPGGKWIYDPQAAERAASQMGHEGDNLLGTPFGNAGLTNIGLGMSGQAQPGLNPGLQPPGGAGLNASQGLRQAAVPQGFAAPPGGGAPSRRDQMGTMANQIVGVVSRSGERAFYRYAQRDYYWDWQFHIFAVIRQMPQGHRPSQPVGGGGGLGPQGRWGRPGQAEPHGGNPRPPRPDQRPPMKDR